MRLIARLLINAFALWLAITIVPGLEFAGGWVTLLIIALIFGVVNALVRPIILFLSCPLIVLTLGLFVLIVNAIMLSLTIWLSNFFDLGLTTTGFWATFWGAVVISIVSGIINLLIRDEREGR